MSDRPATDPLTWLALLVPAAVAAALCAMGIASRSLWLDEGASVAIASQHGAALWRAIAHDGGNMLVFYLALHELIALFGDGTVALRLLSLLGQAATAGLVAWLGLKVFGSRWVALAAGLLVAVSVPLVFWGQDARGYALMVTFATASFVALVGMAGRSADASAAEVATGVGRVSRANWVAYVVAMTIALYLGYDAALVIPAQLLWFVLWRRPLRPLLWALLVVVMLCIPLAVLALQRGSGQLFWVPPLSGSILGQTLATLVSAGLPPNVHTTALTVVCAGFISGLAVVALLRVARGTVARGDRAADLEARALLPALWLAVPMVLAVLAAAVGEPLELARIAILCIPALALLLAGMMLPPLGSPRARRVGVAGLAVLLALRIAVLVPYYGSHPEPWRMVSAHVLAAARPGDCVAFYPQDGRMPFDYYVRRRSGAALAVAPPRAILPAAQWAARTPYVEAYRAPDTAAVAQLTAGCGRVWLIASHQGQAHGTARSRANLAGYERLQAELAARYSGTIASARYGYAAAIEVHLYTR